VKDESSPLRRRSSHAQLHARAIQGGGAGVHCRREPPKGGKLREIPADGIRNQRPGVGSGLVTSYFARARARSKMSPFRARCIAIRKGDIFPAGRSLPGASVHQLLETHFGSTLTTHGLLDLRLAGTDREVSIRSTLDFHPMGWRNIANKEPYGGNSNGRMVLVWAA
jgi:hypothetical protein